MRVAPKMLCSARVASRLAAAVAAALLVLAVGGTTAFADGFTVPGLNGPSVCPGGTGGTSGQIVNTGQAFSVSVGANISCPEPGGTSFGDVAKAGYTTYSSTKNGSPCTVYRYQPLTFSDQGETGKATYTFPNGQTETESLSNFPNAAYYNYWIKFSQNGVYENGSCDTGNSLTWQEDGVVSGEVYITSSTSQFTDNPNPWAMNMTGFLTDNSGTVGTMPENKGLVGLAQCFWINNVEPAHEREVILAGTPDATGREIRYVLVITAQLGAVKWWFGDNSVSEPAPSVCGSHSDITAHTYKQISWYQPNHVYSDIHAIETWTLSAYLYWDDSAGFHSETINLTDPTQTIVTPSVTLSVGQEEGVPVQ